MWPATLCSLLWFTVSFPAVRVPQCINQPEEWIQQQTGPASAVQCCKTKSEQSHILNHFVLSCSSHSLNNNPPPSSLRICESWKKLKCKWDVFLNLNQTKVGLIYVLVRKEDKALWDRTADIHWQSIGGSVLRIAWNERTCTQNRCKIDLFKRWQYSGGNQW